MPPSLPSAEGGEGRAFSPPWTRIPILTENSGRGWSSFLCGFSIISPSLSCLMPGMVAALLAQLLNWRINGDMPGVRWWVHRFGRAGPGRRHPGEQSDRERRHRDRGDQCSDPGWPVHPALRFVPLRRPSHVRQDDDRHLGGARGRAVLFHGHRGFAAGPHRHVCGGAGGGLRVANSRCCRRSRGARAGPGSWFL